MPVQIQLLLVAFAALMLLNFILLFFAYKRVPPNKMMVVSGFGGVRIICAGGNVVLPGLQQHAFLDLLPIVVRIDNRDRPGLPPSVTVCIRSDSMEFALKAATRLIGKTEQQVGTLVGTLVDESLDEMRRSSAKDENVFWTAFRARLQELGLVIVGDSASEHRS